MDADEIEKLVDEHIRQGKAELNKAQALMKEAHRARERADEHFNAAERLLDTLRNKTLD